MATYEHDIVDSSEYHPHKSCNVIIKTMGKMSPRYDHGWHGPPPYHPVPYYTPIPVPTAAPVTPPATMDPMQIIATMALVTFLLQSLMGLLDRLLMGTRVVQARDEQKAKNTQRILKAIDTYQSKNWEENRDKEIK